MIFATVYPWVQNLIDTYDAMPKMAQDITQFVLVMTVVVVFLKVWFWLFK